MRTVFAIFFLVMFGIASNVKPSYYYYWKANQKSITKELCENKDKPVLECNGKCYLAKKINVSDQSEDSKQSNSRELRIPTIEYIPFSYTEYTFQEFKVIKTSKLFVKFNNDKIQSGYLRDCFKPPIFKA